MNWTEVLVELLKLKRKSMPHHSTYRRILAEVVNVEELEAISSVYLSGEKYFGKQVLWQLMGMSYAGRWMSSKMEPVS